MKSRSSHTHLAAAAEVLSTQLRAHLKRWSSLFAPVAGQAERRFLSRLARLGFDARQRKALAAIAPGAAARILADGRPPADFFEQVEYNGRRLAKLRLSPAEIIRALREYDNIRLSGLGPMSPADTANFRWARNQLHFCAVLTLNNAFYQVRETETRTFYELFRAEVESRGLDQLLSRFLDILTHFSRAQAGALFLRNGSDRTWTRRAVVPAPEGDAAPGSQSPCRFDRLGRPRYLESGGAGQDCWLLPEWRERYACCWSVPLAAEGRTLGVMQFAFDKPYEWLPRELELLEVAAERCILAAQKARLMEELAEREEQVRGLAEHLIQVEEMERRRVSRELHDEAGQSLLYIRLQLEMLERSVASGNPALAEQLGQLRDLLEKDIIEIRRVIGALSPAVLAQLGLAPALRQLVSQLRRRHPARVRLQVSRLGRLPEKTEATVYRLAQECCNNIIKHSSATHVNLSLRSADGVLRLNVEDDGVGFRVEEALAKRDSFGLAGIRERVALFGGRFDIRTRPGMGTKIKIELPLPHRAKHEASPTARRANVARAKTESRQ
ncbi:MAG: GAF domain-containing sensor histidine kinase [Acidobacteriales bacterium]|nr:GAF domain-containing sensor histidine kinase [Terriglobales bacterium]